MEGHGRGDQALQAEWKTIGPVPQESSQELWDRFRGAGQQLLRAAPGALWELREEQEENLRKKEALCVRAEELSQSTQWKATAEALKALQAEWKTIGRCRASTTTSSGSASAGADELLRAPPGALREAGRKDQEENLRRKEALCVRAEELSQSTQWKATAEAIKALQAEWKAVGPVPQETSDAIWKRFRRPIDVFFERQAAYFEHATRTRPAGLGAARPDAGRPGAQARADRTVCASRWRGTRRTSAAGRRRSPTSARARTSTRPAPAWRPRSWTSRAG